MPSDASATSQQMITILHEDYGLSLAVIAVAACATRTSISQIYHGYQSGYNLYPALERLCVAILTNYEAKGQA